jgi:hypothetical protein
MKKYLVPVAVGVVVFGAVTAFAATLTVNSNSLGAGNSAVNSCTTDAKVTYNTVGTSAAKTYKVTTAPVTTSNGATASTACAGMAYRVTLLDVNSNPLAEATGVLDANGAATAASVAPAAVANFSGQNIAAEDVRGVAVVVTG